LAENKLMVTFAVQLNQLDNEQGNYKQEKRNS
jgi:hypothetical protein